MNVNDIIEICKNTVYCYKCKLYDKANGDCKYSALYPRDWIPDNEPETITEPSKPSKKKRGI